MGRLAQRLMAWPAEVFITRDVGATLREKDDDRVDDLHRTILKPTQQQLAQAA